MLLIDANAILRYMLRDNPEMADEVKNLLVSSRVFVRYEVLAEVVYVLYKVYSLPKNEIVDGIGVFLAQSNVETESSCVLSFALMTYAEKSLDFVDCLLYAYVVVKGCSVYSFDKQLVKLIKNLSE